MSIFDTPATEGAPAGDNAGVADLPNVNDAAGMPDLSDGTADLGGAESGSEGAPPAPEPQYLDIDQFGDHLVKVKIDGEEKELPFKKVREGLMMQEAFTKRTQSLAEERRKLQQADALVAALESDPAGTLRQLTEVYDLDAASGFTPVERDPQEQRLIEQQRALAAQQQQLTEQRLQNEIAALKAQHGDFDLPKLARYAYENNIPSLGVAFKAMQFEEQSARQAQAAQAAARRDKARDVAATIHSGGATQNGAVGESTKPAGSVREAFLAAKRQHNRT